MLLSKRVTAVLSASLLTLACQATQAADSLNFVSWGGTTQDAQKEAWAVPFTKATDIKVVQDGPTDYGKLKAMVESGNVQWDVVDVEADFALRAASEGLLEPLDFTQIKRDKIDPRFVSDHGVGSFFFSFVLGYNEGKLGANKPVDWSALFDTKTYPGKRALYKWPSPGVLELALLADGVPADKLYPLDLDRAFKALDAIKPKIDVWWNSGAQVEQMLKSGEVDMIATWVSRPQSANADGAKIGIVWNQNIWGVDSWSILAGTPNADACREFIKFASEPQRMGSLSQYFAAGVTQPEAFKYIKPELAKDSPTYPDNIKNGVQIDAKYWVANQAAVIEKFNGWVLK